MARSNAAATSLKPLKTGPTKNRPHVFTVLCSKYASHFPSASGSMPRTMVTFSGHSCETTHRGSRSMACRWVFIRKHSSNRSYMYNTRSHLPSLPIFAAFTVWNRQVLTIGIEVLRTQNSPSFQVRMSCSPLAQFGMTGLQWSSTLNSCLLFRTICIDPGAVTSDRAQQGQ